jgi:hypothetical protein
MTATADKTAAGYANVETYRLIAWLTGERETRRYWYEIAQAAHTVDILAEELKEHYTTLAESTVPSGVLDDLMRCALGRVNWIEVAKAIRHFNPEMFNRKKIA